MNRTGCISAILLLLLCIGAGCASVGTLEGGKKDTTPPKLISITPADSQLNTRVNRIELRFDEFIALNDPAKEIQISPLLAIQPQITSINKKVTVKIPDTLLMENTTYRISFGGSVKDIHEDNKISGLTYTFSTGSYFDSLEINGQVIDARSGLPDTSAVILLYNASVDDSAVIRSRPLYVGRAGAGGNFSVKGLPGKSFRVYALNDGNDNLIYNGGNEKIAFNNEVIMPGDSLAKIIQLRSFQEIQDTSSFPDSSASSVSDRAGSAQGKERRTRKEETLAADFSYTLGVDTSNINARVKDITKPLEITFSSEIDSFFVTRMSLSLDSINTQAITVVRDTTRKNVLKIYADWKTDTLYTLRLLKGFARDSAGTEALPSKYFFRTKREDDYSKLIFKIPAKYTGNKYIMLIETGVDTVYNRPIADSTINIIRLNPGSYRARIIVDENGNGTWDTGDLLLKRQPELVIPYNNAINLKPGWDNTFDFQPQTPGDRKGRSPDKRDRYSPK
jgi:hypothetical protein